MTFRTIQSNQYFTIETLHQNKETLYQNTTKSYKKKSFWEIKLLSKKLTSDNERRTNHDWKSSAAILLAELIRVNIVKEWCIIMLKYDWIYIMVIWPNKCQCGAIKQNKVQLWYILYDIKYVYKYKY